MAVCASAIGDNAGPVYARVQERYPLLASAIPRRVPVRNWRNAAHMAAISTSARVATIFNDTGGTVAINDTGSGCGAIGGVTRIHAILGAKRPCYRQRIRRTLCRTRGACRGGPCDRARWRPRHRFSNYHRLPGAEPWQDNANKASFHGDRSPKRASQQLHYLKLRDRLSYASRLSASRVADAIGGRGVSPTCRIGARRVGA